MGEAKNYRGITLTSIAEKVLSSQNQKKFFVKIKTALEKISQILTVRRLIEGCQS